MTKKNNNQEWFADKNISSIAGHNGEIEGVTDLLELKRKEITNFMKETGFVPKNISHMLSSCPDTSLSQIEKRLNSLLDKKDDLILISAVFEPESISTMLGGSRDNLEHGVDILNDNLGKLEQFINKGIFTSKNVAAILSNGASAKEEQTFAKNVEYLLTKQDELIDFTKTTPYTAGNVSTILDKAMQNTSKEIDELLRSKDKLIALADNEPFSAENITTMLSRSGENLEKKIYSIERHKDELNIISNRDGYDANKLASALSRVPFENLDRTIIELEKGNVAIIHNDSNRGYKIAALSEAAEQAEKNKQVA
ncbi:MAG: hypothetical protein R3D71_07820 [Rickettsiales bacterium]